MLYAAAGECGVNPDPLTMAELLAMADGRARAEWQRAAALIAAVHNAARDPRHWLAASRFDPFAAMDQAERDGRSGQPQMTIGRGRGFELLKAAFVDRRNARNTDSPPRAERKTR